MSCNMMTLHEIGLAWAKKQPGIIDDLTEDSPILDMIKWKAASHKMWNAAEKLVDIDGPGWTEPDAPLPMMQASTDLVHIDLHVLGGQMEVTTQKALKFGGPKKYFADRQNWILRHAGMTTEKQIVLQNMLKAATTWKNKAGVKSNVYDAGGSGQGWFILACRFDDQVNVGLYDPDQFDSGRLLKIDFPYNGAEHVLHGSKYEGVLGYSIVYRGNFGYQILDPERTVAAIVNIDETHKPSVTMIDDMLAQVRSQPGSTYSRRRICQLQRMRQRPAPRTLRAMLLPSTGQGRHQARAQVKSRTQSRRSSEPWRRPGPDFATDTYPDERARLPQSRAQVRPGSRPPPEETG